MESPLEQRPWLDYAGQSIDELIAKEHTHRADSLVVAIEQALQDKPLGKLTTAERTVLAVSALEREVNNGGYAQFFANASREWAPDIVESLRRIGCPLAAKITQDAIDSLHLDQLTPEAVEAMVEKDDDVRDAALQLCDDRFAQYPEDIASHLFAYIKSHRAEISG